ncbi:MAG TPA: glycoside hydrolase family 6 protein [Solirubrobacteraceae bacterium]|jgi:endoglucanase
MTIQPRSARRLPTLAAVLALAVIAGWAWHPAIASADGESSISLDQSAYTAHENQGYLEITIQRTGDLSQAAHVGYGVKRQDAQPGIDFDLVPNTYITIPPGQSTYTFQVRIIDQGLNATPVYALAYLYSAWPESLGAYHNSLITILHDDALAARDVVNPLGVPAPINANPIAGAKFYVDPASSAALAVRHFAGSKPAWAGLLNRIASAPAAHRLYMWNLGANVAGQVAHYLEGTQLQQPGSTVMLSTYNLVHGKCGFTATPAMQQRYDSFISQVAQGIGNTHVVFFLELDSLITAPCLNHAQLAIREAELRYAVAALEADPHVVVYLDGGAADAATAQRQAGYLRASGVGQAQGFFLNSTHFDWTTSELRYGQQISRMLGGAHFVINTGENGRGPLRPRNLVKQGNEVLCNPPGRGLGPLTVSGGVAQQTGYAGADGFLWFSNPGGSGGQCVPGAPPTGVFWPAYAVMLAKNWVDRVNGPSARLARAAR